MSNILSEVHPELVAEWSERNLPLTPDKITYNTDRIGDIRCLCPKCLNDYFRNPNYVARRLDPFQKSKGTCDKCNDRGWDYIIYDKRTSFKGKGV